MIHANVETPVSVPNVELNVASEDSAHSLKSTS